MSTEELKGKWVLDPAHSTVGFTARLASISKICGTFDRIEATVVYSEPTADVEATIATDSFESGNALRDAQIKSADFLAVDEYPEITFRGKFDGASKLTGELTAHGVSRQADFDVAVFNESLDEYGGGGLDVRASSVINRKDYDLVWSTAGEKGELILSDNVTIELSLRFVRE